MAKGPDELGGGGGGGGTGGLDTMSPAEFAQAIKAAFESYVYRPMMRRATLSPEDVPPVLVDLRKALGILQQAIDPFDQGGDTPPPADPAPSSPRPSAPEGGASSAASAPAETPRPALAVEASRSQRSKMRELVLLEMMQRENRPCTLAELMIEIAARGFEDTSAAVVSQMHRLRALDVVNVQGSGIYQITEKGILHLHRLRGRLGGLMPKG